MQMGSDVITNRYASRAGEKVGSLTFLGLAAATGDGGRALGEFRCVCGKIVNLPAGRVLNAKARQHCGCLTDRGAHRTHGMHGTPEYSSWQAMKNRCLDPNNKDFPRWGARGVTVCDEWASSFESFFAHIGPRPNGTTLDRIDNLRGYEPGNVRWATPQQQQINRSTNWIVTIDGLTFESQKEAADHFGVSETTIVRWCEGYVDARRVRQTGGGRIEPRPNCSRRLRYAGV
jgi:hypothetical protein